MFSDCASGLLPFVHAALLGILVCYMTLDELPRRGLPHWSKDSARGHDLMGCEPSRHSSQPQWLWTGLLGLLSVIGTAAQVTPMALRPSLAVSPTLISWVCIHLQFSVKFALSLSADSPDAHPCCEAIAHMPNEPACILYTSAFC